MTEAATAGYQASVLDYFASKASRYDRVDEQHYWRLSDALLWRALERFTLPSVPSDARILDAGGGTGRWSDRLLRELPEARGTIVDISTEMTDQAQKKAAANGYRERFEVKLGDLAHLSDVVPPSSFDFAICFHNVLGFVADPDAVFREIAGSLKPGGMFAFFVPNESHAAYFNLTLGNIVEAVSIVRDHRGRFTSDMPPMHLFSASTVVERLAAAGLEAEIVTGTPVYIYPGYAESQIEGNSTGLRDVLADPAGFKSVFELEEAQLGRADLAARGNNLLLIGRRRSDG